ncbi:MAG TPA: hypothetical protein VH583_25125 [Vicinamibacterales bacterium]|jgi:hypothetical protein
MSQAPPFPTDQLLISYLVGRCPAEEEERLDELSIVDDEFADRLNAVEHDLVDAYVAGELKGDTLDAFRFRYLASSVGRRKIAFADALRSRAAESKPVPAAEPERRRWFTWPQLAPQWAMAAVAVAAVAASVYLVVENRRLTTQIGEGQSARTALEQRQTSLEQQLASERSASNAANQELTRARDEIDRSGKSSPAGASHAGLLAFLLPPATRGAETMSIRVPQGTDRIQLRLPLESTDFRAYDATLKTAAGDVVWRGAAELSTRGTSPEATITVPAAELSARGYVVELSGLTRAGTREFAGSYPFRITGH